ncbi:MAG: TonB family protein [Terracidiphilus sp.]
MLLKQTICHAPVSVGFMRQSTHWTVPVQGEVTMRSPAARSRLLFRALFTSVAFHGAFFACVYFFGTHARVVIVQPVKTQVVAQLAFAGGSHRITIELPVSHFAAITREPVRNAPPARKTDIPMQVPALKQSGGGSTLSPHHGDGSSKAPTGNGSDLADIHPAFPVFSPHPPVTDRSLLPSSEQKIVVDVSVDAFGQVVSESLVKGLGNNLDRIVLETVRTWRFQPATLNGKPVATEAELIFPFNLDYPITIS